MCIFLEVKIGPWILGEEALLKLSWTYCCIVDHVLLKNS